MGESKEKGYVTKARAWLCIGFCSLCGILLVIGGILVYLLFRDFVAGMIKNEIPLRVGSQVTDSWMHPPVKPLLRIYFFNTTNPEGYLKGEKPYLVEMGPYTWEEEWAKVGVSWGEEGNEVKYSIRKTYRFRRDLSIGGEDDRITVPNVPLFASVNQMRFAGKLVQQALSQMLGILKQEAFNSTTVGDMVWGYDHPLIKLGNDVLPPEKKLPFDKFGYFVDKNNSLEGEYLALTGADDVSKVGKVLSYQGKQKLDFWTSEECNEIKGTDGTMFHPDVARNETLYIFNMNLCQSLPLTYQEDVKHHGINTYRFVPPTKVFGSPEENPRNKCFCEGDHCAPSGLFNVSKCQFGSPIMLSWPHFFQADPKLLEGIDGLQPNREKHQFHIDIVPAMGVGMRAAARSQVNLVMHKVDHVSQLKGVRDLIYPILWFEDGIEELSDADTLSLLHMAVHTPETARSIMYPSMLVLGSLLLLAAAAIMLRKHMNSSKSESFDSGSIALPTKDGIVPRIPTKNRDHTPPPDYDEAV